VGKEFVNSNEDLLDPKDDIVFKAMLTSANEASYETLKHIISDFTGLKIEEVRVTENEPQGGNVGEKHLRLDVSCVFNGKEVAEVEMTMDANKFEFIRNEHYLSRLYSSAKTMGIKKYEDYPEAYQISIIGNRIVNYDNEDPISFYEFCDLKTKKPINGKMHMIIAELKKIKTEDIGKMTAKEKWAAFFKWSADKSKADKLSELIKTEEGLQMATGALRYVSKDETTRRMLIQREMARRDWDDKLAHAIDDGIQIGEAKGIQIGEAKGIQIGEAKGRAEMKIERDREIAKVAKNLIGMNLPVEQISQATGLSSKEIEKLK
jgi:predicted transposase/invertase (TIGR01784 family)